MSPEKVALTIREIVMQAAKPFAKASAESAAPWLKLPVINFFFNLIIDIYAAHLSKALEKFAFFAIVDVNTGEEAASVKVAKDTLQNALATGVGIEKATNDYRAAIHVLISLQHS